jgi:hypothetical protein
MFQMCMLYGAEFMHNSCMYVRISGFVTRQTALAKKHKVQSLQRLKQADVGDKSMNIILGILHVIENVESVSMQEDDVDDRTPETQKLIPVIAVHCPVLPLSMRLPITTKYTHKNKLSDQKAVFPFACSVLCLDSPSITSATQNLFFHLLGPAGHVQC